MQEILVVAAIVLAIIFVPRLMGNKTATPSPRHSDVRSRNTARAGVGNAKISLTGRMRLAILLTLIWISACTVYYKPWESNHRLFILVAFLPVTIFWGAIWVWLGYKKHRR
ncbi:MAG: hypothetical protein WAP08_08080 [Smithellaceae bacterium]|jgi:hypothetical protein|nr:hypothetical protein [Syntrophaceae bacterium]